MTELEGLSQRAGQVKKDTINIRETLDAARKAPETLNFADMDTRIAKLKSTIDT